MNWNTTSTSKFSLQVTGQRRFLFPKRIHIDTKAGTPKSLHFEIGGK